MSDMSQADVAAFDSAHDKLTALKGTSDVQELVAKLVSGLLTLKGFVVELFKLPQVQSLVLSIDAGAASGVGALVTAGFPMIPGLGLGVGALFKLGADAIAHSALPTPNPTP